MVDGDHFWSIATDGFESSVGEHEMQPLVTSFLT